MGSQHWMDIFFNKNGVAVSNPVEVMLYLQQDTSMLKIWYKNTYFCIIETSAIIWYEGDEIDEDFSSRR